MDKDGLSGVETGVCEASVTGKSGNGPSRKLSDYLVLGEIHSLSMEEVIEFLGREDGMVC